MVVFEKMIFLFFDTEFTRFSNPDVVRFSSIESFTYFSGDQDEDFCYVKIAFKKQYSYCHKI